MPCEGELSSPPRALSACAPGPRLSFADFWIQPEYSLCTSLSGESIPEFQSVLLILHMALRFLDQCAEESIAFQSGVAESTVLQMMTMQQTISRGPGMAPVKAPNTTAQAE